MSKSCIRNQAEMEQRINDLVDRLAADFDLGWMHLTNTFDPKNDGDRVLCETICDFEYRQANFRWNLHQVASTTDEDLELTAIHELVHCLNAPTYESLKPKQQNRIAKLNELSVENITRVIAHLYKGSNT